jgi:hypothetical protein
VLERDTRRLKDVLQHRGAHAELAAALVDEDEEAEEHTAQDCTDGDGAPQQQQKQQQQHKKQQQQPEKSQRSSSVHNDAAAVAVKEEVKAELQEDCDGSDAPRGESPVQQQQHPLAAALLPPTPLQYLPTRVQYGPPHPLTALAQQQHAAAMAALHLQQQAAAAAQQQHQQQHPLYAPQYHHHPLQPYPQLMMHPMHLEALRFAQQVQHAQLQAQQQAQQQQQQQSSAVHYPYGVHYAPV